MTRKEIRFEDLSAVLESWEQELKLLREVADAAEEVTVQFLTELHIGGGLVLQDRATRLHAALRTLRSWDADRGVRGSSTSREQEVRESPAERAGDHEGNERQG